MLIHIAAQPIQIGPQLRQRCGWCGAVLQDTDLTQAMVPEGQADREFPTWETGGLVAIDGGTTWVVPHEDGDELPDEACACIPHDVTGHREVAS